MTADGVKTIDFLGFGISAVDDVLEVEAWPEPGTKVHVTSRNRYGGGLCTTALVAAARLGMRCRYEGLLGENDLSDYVREALAREGIGLPENRRHPAAEPFNAVVVIDRTSGERTILTSSLKVIPPSPADVREDLIRQSRAVFIDHLGVEGGLHACRLARMHGVPTVGDIERIDDHILPLVERIDHLILPLRVAQEHTGLQRAEDAVAALAKTPRPCTAVTDGIRGCWFIEHGGTVQHQPAFKVSAVDTTGCGDVFHGAYAAGIVWGWPVREAIRFAAAAAALKATQFGAMAGAPDRNTVEQFLASVSGPDAAKQGTSP